MSKFKYVKHSLTAVACAVLIAVNGMPMSINAETTATKQEMSATSAKDTKEAQNKVTSPIAKIEASGQSTNLALDGDLGDEDSRSILGGSWYYGIVADEFDFNGESETNFAVKTFKHQNNGTGGQTGITDKGEGSEIAYFVAGKVDAQFIVKGINALISCPQSEEDKFLPEEGPKDKLKFKPRSENQIDDYVDALRSNAKSESKKLVKFDSVTNYSNLPSDKMTIDITSAGDNSTVYLNVDAWEGLKYQLTQSSGITIRKKEGQKVVFNFPKSTDVITQKIVIDQGPTTIDSTHLADQSTKDGHIAADIIFNMPNATSVTLNDTTGIILAPNAAVHCYGVEGGWINCKTLINGAEWHFINGELTKDNKPSIFENPKTPTETPKTPSVTPKTPTETPKTPSVTPKTPTETPKIPSVTPKTPTETPKTPSVTPKTPTETPKIPSVTPKTPTETPKAPTETPKTPTETPKTPSVTPKTPTETPKIPSVTPKTPTETPKTPTETPKTPSVTPKTPTETPKIPSVTPKTPTETPKTPTETPKIPSDTSKNTSSTTTSSESTSSSSGSTNSSSSSSESTDSKSSSASSTESTDSKSSTTSSTDSTNSTTSGKKTVVVTQNNQNTGNTSGGQTTTTYANTPVSSNEVTQTSEGSTTTRSPQTGDTNRVGVYGTTLVAALFVLCLVLRKRSSKNK